MNWFKRLFLAESTAPAETGIEQSGLEVTKFCGMTIQNFVRGEWVIAGPFPCGQPDCKTCNPMTPQRAAKINERFFRERG